MLGTNSRPQAWKTKAPSINILCAVIMHRWRVSGKNEVLGSYRAGAGKDKIVNGVQANAIN